MTAFEPVIGLEVHAELQTRSKMFCACPVVDTISAAPNSAVCEVCTGMPGTLPVINERAVEFALRAALALHCRVEPTSVFARKNYFYPDLPKGFQISQYEMPLASAGWLEIPGPEGPKRVAVRRVHLEEDTGKLFHRGAASLVDYNRSGVPLLEVVSEPELFSIDEVKVYATALRDLLRYIRITSGDMEKGAIRFEANISLRPAGSSILGTRTEIKNLNSFRSMLRALVYEIERHRTILTGGGRVAQETLRWNEARGETYPERGKEEADDYRYFPEPDLPPLVVDSAWVERLRASLPELPWQRRARLVADHGLSLDVAALLTAERDVADFFEAALAAAPGLNPMKIAHWVTGELFSHLHQDGLEINQSKLPPQALAAIVTLVEEGGLSAASGKEVLAEAFRSGETPQHVVERLGLSQVQDRETIDHLVSEVLRANPAQVEQYLNGKRPIAEWLFGQVMRAAGGRANPAIVRSALQARLKALEESRRRL
jgi:aspartyl-tRNA(Asn)/glutamyl-tRNA(Gln) amidotransferase subunit B